MDTCNRSNSGWLRKGTFERHRGQSGGGWRRRSTERIAAGRRDLVSAAQGTRRGSEATLPARSGEGSGEMGRLDRRQSLRCC